MTGTSNSTNEDTALLILKETIKCFLKVHRMFCLQYFEREKQC